MLNVAPQKERIPDHLRAMAEQDDKSAASGKTGEQSSIGVGCAPGEERDSAISICAVHSTTVTAAIAEFCEDTVEKHYLEHGNCGTTREGEVDLVHPLKAGFETDPKSATQPALDPSSKLDLAARSKLTLAVPISDLAAA